jgi:hypothetical protein
MGGKEKPTRSVYRNMIRRCYEKTHSNYRKYGAKGITVCDRWLGEDGYINFVSDMGEKPEGLSLDRIDGTKGYSTENCRWTTPRIQSINRGKQSNNKSGHPGVRWFTRTGRWQARIRNFGRDIHLGYFDKFEDAVEAYLVARKKYHSEGLK